MGSAMLKESNLFLFQVDKDIFMKITSKPSKNWVFKKSNISF